MKNIILSFLFGFGSLSLIACSGKNEPLIPESKSKAIAKDELNLAGLGEAETITNNTYLRRYVDCKAGVTIYALSTGLAIVPNSQISEDFIKERCKP